MRFSLVSIASIVVLHSKASSFTVGSSKSVARNKAVQLGMSSTVTTATGNVGAVGSKLTDMELALEALGKFFDGTDGMQITPTSGGVNNIVQYITLPSGERELLRIYNNGCNSQRVKFEHEILSQLNQLPLSFGVPNFIKSKEGSTMVRLSNGADACMCKLIPGHLPKLSCFEDIGRASGELNTAMAGLTVDPSMCNTAPYWKIWDVHHAVNRENFEAEMRGPNFSGDLKDVAERMLKETLDIVAKCEGQYQSLPVQLIHGDLHYDNVLVLDGQVTALLDYEFSSFDWRAMELAICLTKYAGEEKGKEYFEQFIQGFAKMGKLTRAEAEAIPDLMNLRILSNVVYFVGRHLAGEDDISSLTTRIANYERRVNWVKDQSKFIIDNIIEKMGLE